MRTVVEARDELKAALTTVADLSVYTVAGANLNVPAAVIGPPDLTWEGGYGVAEPSDATFPIAVVVAQNESAVDVLEQLIVQVTDAIYNNTEDMAVTAANPETYPTGNSTALPCYVINCEVTL